MKLKIYIVLGPFLSTPPNPTGAVERRWSDIADSFALKGHDVTLVGKELNGRSVAGVHYISDRGESRCGSLWREILLDIRYANRISKHLCEADIIITNTFALPVVLSSKKREGADYKIVVNLARMPKGQLFMYRNVDRFAAVSESVLEIVRLQDERAYKKCIVIENPIDCSIFNSKNKTANESGCRKILYAGRISKEKGLEILIETVRLLNKSKGNEYSLKIVGPHRVEQGGDGDAYLIKLKNMAKGEMIEFKEPVWEKQKLASLYKTADIFVYPSLAEHGETFGIAPLEAMGCGAPTIVSNLKCFSQYVRDGENALVAKIVGEKNASTNLCSKILELENRKKYEYVQEGGIKTAEQYDTSIIAEKYLCEFDKLKRKDTRNEN